MKKIGMNIGKGKSHLQMKRLIKLSILGNQTELGQDLEAVPQILIGLIDGISICRTKDIWIVYYEAPGKGEDDKFAKPFEITELGYRLIKAIPEDEVAHDEYQTDSITVDEQIIFCHVMAKFESSNPLRRVSFQNSSLPLLLSALLTLKNIGEKPQISHSEML